MKKILFMLLLFSLTFSSVTEVQNVISQSTNSYIIILITFFLSALVYMGGSLFSVPKWIAKSKDLLYQGIFSLVIMATFPVIFIIFSIFFKSIFLGGYVIPPNTDIFDIAGNLLLWNYIYYFIHLLFVTLANMIVLSVFGRPYSVPLSGQLISFDLTVLQSPLLFIVNAGVGIISFSIMINGFQMLFLNFVRYTLLPFLLPLGLILRAFPSSMHAGNVLVGIALAAFIIVPMVYAIDLQILPTILDNPNTSNPNVKVYDHFGVMRSFYTKESLDLVVFEKGNCNIISESRKKFDLGLIDIDSVSELSKSADNCGPIYVGSAGFFMDVFSNILEPVDNVELITGAGWISAHIISKGIGYFNVLERIYGTENGGDVSKDYTENMKTSFMNVVRVTKVFDTVTGIGALFYIVSIFYKILLGIIASFVILSAILPFIKFTIIILFIREFTLNFLGTQVSLGQITRLL